VYIINNILTSDSLLLNNAVSLDAAPMTRPLVPSVRIWGHIAKIQGQSLIIKGLNAFAGLGALIEIKNNEETRIGEIISLEGHQAIAMMFSETSGLRIGQRAYICDDPAPRPSESWRLSTGVAAIDCFLPVCKGQRMGLFAGSGVGKSTLLGTIAKAATADISIIALIGERGREVRHFIEHTLGPEGMKKAIVFAATSDQPSAIKMRTAHLAMATAEYFRDQNKQVLFLFDSLTRYAEAHRDIALSSGEVPSLRAYPPSTFRALAGFCERSGPGIKLKNLPPFLKPLKMNPPKLKANFLGQDADPTYL